MPEHIVRALVFSLALAVAVAASGALPATAQQVLRAPNSTPLSFGMDVNQAELALGTTLNYVSGRPGDEIFVALPNVKGSALSSRNDGLYLQFRRGRLEGWKGDWGANRP
jgi:hypothetical protein